MIQHTVGAWRIVFFITAGIYVFGAIFYGLFGTAAQQMWGLSSDLVATAQLSA